MSLVGQKVWVEELGCVGTVVEVREGEDVPYEGMAVLNFGDGDSNTVWSLDDIETEADMEQEIAWRRRVLLDLRAG